MKTVTLSALVLLTGLGGALPVLSAAPLVDRLERPSRPSPMAALVPLTDIQALGRRLVMVGSSGHVLLRDADGDVRQARVPADLLLTAVHFVDSRRGWAVGHDGVILHSLDGGESWSKQLDGRDINRMMLAWAEGEVERLERASAAAPDDEPLLAALDNAHFALDDASAGSAPGPSRPLLDLWFRDAQEGWAVGAYGIIVHTRDGGQSWQYVPGLDNPERLHLNSVLGLADGSLLVAGEGGRLYRSNDNGRNWSPAAQLTDASLYKLLALADGRLLALGFGGALLASQDAGGSWQSIPLPVRVGLYGGTQLADGRLLLVGQGGVLLLSDDGRRFAVWQAPHQAPLLGVSAVDGEHLALVGSAGLQVLPLAAIQEQLQ
ncbi:WD40/YVTN/BNR-like repeat-containing protein [Metapseudomonas furukawaii]|uniref:WD40/YVTN/BNR-like repeat-containing protein n=1 Tax=Metapseudomonas furukawaii TaxID=1149133 RepID=UPI0040462099